MKEISLTGHLRATRVRFQATSDTVLVLHGPTELIFNESRWRGEEDVNKPG